jgi:AP-3 complex subunit delta-1
MSETAKQILFQNSLAEVVRKIRNSKKNESETIQQCLAEIKSEVSSTAQSVKVMAVIKLTYFAMLGYNADYGAFNIIEVMADPQFQNKRTGYVAASLTFTERTDVLPLVTALLKKDLTSSNQYEVGLALYCLASVCTPDLAKDLVSDVVNLLTSPRAYIRKKASLCLYKIFIQFPEALRPTYPKLKEKLDDNGDRTDNDPSVRGAIVSVLCELSRRNPQNFLNLAVPFFGMLSSVHNNWTLIKIIKVFGYFAPLEPRLGKKLVEPLTNLITTSGAKSVQYECIYAVANGMSKVSALTKLACEKMKYFVEDPDQNLKYLGLDAMTRVMIENPKMLSDQREVILACLDDSDTTIRRKALELLKGVSTKKNLVSTVNSMFDRCVRNPPEEEWSNLVIQSIIETAQTEDYLNVQDFEWYIGVLIDLSLIELSTFKHGGLIQREIVTICTRVNAVRQFAVEALTQLLSNSNILNCNTNRSTQWEVIKAVAFVCGEYPHWIADKRLVCIYLLSERIALLPPDVQVQCVAAAGKIYSFAVKPCARHLQLQNGEEDGELPGDAIAAEDLKMALLPPEDGPMKKGLNLFCHSVFPDVQERAQFVFYHVQTAPEVAHLFYELELTAIAAGAQEAVVLPEGLDLDKAFCDNIPALVADSEPDTDSDDEEVSAPVEKHRKDAARREEVSAFYIKDAGFDRRDEDLPPVVKLDTVSTAGSSLRNARSSGKKVHTMSRELSKPANYVATSTSKRTKSPEEDEAARRLRAIDVTKALAPEERLPEATPYAKLLLKGNSADTPAEEPARQFDAVTLCEDRHCRLVAQVLECKAKKEGIRLSITFAATNLSSSSSLYDVTVAVGECAYASIGSNEGEDGLLAERIKPTVTTHKEISIMLMSLPESFSEMIPLVVTFTKEKKSVSISAQLELKFGYFVSAEAASVKSEDFNGPILTSLADATCLSAHVPLGKKKTALLLLPSIRRSLSLTTMDVFKDCIALHVQLVHRKNSADKSHVAIVLREEKVDGENGITILAKSHYPAIVEAAVTEIAALMQA